MFYFFPEITFTDFNGAIFLSVLLMIISLIGLEALKRFLNDLF